MVLSVFLKGVYCCLPPLTYTHTHTHAVAAIKSDKWFCLHEIQDMCHFKKRGHKDNHTLLPCMAWDSCCGMYTLLSDMCIKQNNFLVSVWRCWHSWPPMASEPRALKSAFYIGGFCSCLRSANQLLPLTMPQADQQLVQVQSCGM